MSLVFRYRGSTPRPVDRIESIINRDKKTATYKLALLRALCDIALTSYPLVRWEAGGNVGVPLKEVALRWILYYWPLLDAPDGPFPQIAGGHDGTRNVAFHPSLGAMIDHYRLGGQLSSFLRDQKADAFDADGERLFLSALKSIGDTIVKQPIHYAGGARGERVFSYDSDSKRILFDGDLWREFVLMGHWIRDALILRWAELTSSLWNLLRASSASRTSDGLAESPLLRVRGSRRVHRIPPRRRPLGALRGTRLTRPWRWDIGGSRDPASRSHTLPPRPELRAACRTDPDDEAGACRVEGPPPP